MTSYKVQYELPVDNPAHKVRIKKSKCSITFFVPINHPDIHMMTYSDLVEAARVSGLFDLSTPLNTKNTLDKESTNSKDVRKS